VCWGLYTPPPRYPCRTLTFNSLRQWSRMKYIADNCQNITSIRKTTVFDIHIAQFKTVYMYILHNFANYPYFLAVCPSLMYISGLLFCYSSGFSISGSSSAALCLSAICCAVWCGIPSCCAVCTGAVSAMP